MNGLGSSVAVRQGQADPRARYQVAEDFIVFECLSTNRRSWPCGIVAGESVLKPAPESDPKLVADLGGALRPGVCQTCHSGQGSATSMNSQGDPSPTLQISFKTVFNL
jgi:hypothetical protein